MLLEVTGVNKHFGGLKVLQNVSFAINGGEIVGLIGPNGAGKSTLFNVITGVYKPDGGTILFGGKGVAGLKPNQVCKMGIARTFQLVRVFPSMSVIENVLVGAIFGRGGDKKSARHKALECLDILGLGQIKDTVAGRLTYADRKLMEIARAIATEPGLALLDEPLAGLNPAETEKMMGVIKGLRDHQGISMAWVEHKMDAILNLCDRVVVLDYGEKIAEGTPEEISTNKKVMEAYLGEPID